MKKWMLDFERNFEAIVTTGKNCSPDFRCFLSSEPPGDPQDKIIP